MNSRLHKEMNWKTDWHEADELIQKLIPRQGKVMHIEMSCMSQGLGYNLSDLISTSYIGG